MKYYSLSSNTIKITLSEEEMKEYSLCSEGITLRTGESKRILVDMLKKLRLFPGHRAERLFLEAFPRNEGGCVLYVSSLGEESAEEKTEDYSGKIPLMCRTDKLNNLIGLCRGLISFGNLPESCVYRSNDGYAIVVAAETENAAKIKHFLSEYGTVSRSLSEIYALKEYWEPICTENVCQRLAQLY